MKVVMWGGIILLLIFCFISMSYSDIWWTYHHGLQLLDCLAEWRFLEFYEDTSALYFIPIYIIFGIWELPVWLISHFFHINVDGMGCLLWSKGIVVFFAIGCIWMMCYILKELKYNDLEYAVFLFASSLLFVFPSLVASQYDVIELFFLLCGIFYYAKDEKLSWRVLLLFSIAISIKLFAVFIFLVIVLVEEKRILYIVRYILCGVLVSIISMLPFWSRGYWGTTSGHNIGFAYRLLAATLPGGGAGISIFWCGYLAICAVAYFSKEKGKKNHLKFIIWLSMMFFLLLFTFAECFPYWFVLHLPFLVMVIIGYRENLKINILLETAMEIVNILAYGVKYHWVYFSGDLLNSLVFKNADVQSGETANLKTFLGMSEGGISMCMTGAYTLFWVCGVILLVINNPWKPILCESTEREFVMVKKVSRIVRTGIIGAFLLLTLIIAF